MLWKNNKIFYFVMFLSLTITVIPLGSTAQAVLLDPGSGGGDSGGGGGITCMPPNPENNIRNYLPYIYMPSSDVGNGNGIIRVYYKVVDTNTDCNTNWAYQLEITIVWADEDAPYGGDWFYDNFRTVEYGNIKDLETIQIFVEKNSGAAGTTYFYGIWSANNGWNSGSHETHAYYLCWESNPVVYVNTWNHAMDISRSSDSVWNSGTTTYNPYSYAIAHGDRFDAENIERPNGSKPISERYSRPGYP